MKKTAILSIFFSLILAACSNESNESNYFNSQSLKKSGQKESDSQLGVGLLDKDMPSKNSRRPAAAGKFYPGEAEELKAAIGGYLKGVAISADLTPAFAKASEGKPSPTLAERSNPSSLVYQGGVRAILAPHAGYEYSGQVAAHAYKAVEKRQIGTVVLICNSHSAYFSGLAIDASDAWQTPLGEVEIDKDLADKLISAADNIKYDSAAHANEHSLEAQLPFLQTVLPAGFKIVPVLFGNAGDDRYKKLAKALADNLDADDLVVISTDLSHYPKYEDANKIDGRTLDIIKTLDVNDLDDHIAATEAANIANEQTLICGIDGVKTIMELASQKNWQAGILKYANSGDAAVGDKNQVVGYGAMAFVSSEKLEVKSEKSAAEVFDLNVEQRDRLLEIAKMTVEGLVRNGKIPDFNITDERLKQKQGAFVTLKKDGELRGCIGQIIPTEEPLWQVVREMAVEASSKDPRFEPVSKDELDKIDYEVSVLSVPEKINDWHKIELGKHGVIIKKGWQSGVFLPQVAAETGWDLEEFLSQLSWQKAGLPPDSYKNDKGVELQVFTAAVF